MYNLDNDTLLGKAPIPRAVAAMAIPSVISSLVTVVYNMADTFFVGQTGDALQVAAVSLTNPIFILLMAFANMFGMGGSAMISVALGENNHQSVKKISSFISWASLVVGAAFAAVLLCFTAPILHLFGADASTFEFARGYTVYIAFGAPFVIWSAAASFVVRAEGASKEAMIGSMIGTIANISTRFSSPVWDRARQAQPLQPPSAICLRRCTTCGIFSKSRGGFRLRRRTRSAARTLPCACALPASRPPFSPR